MLTICRIKPGSDEKSASAGKLLEMLTTRNSEMNEERAEQQECCLYSL